MDEQGILQRIQSLVDEERALREKAEAQSGPDRAPDRSRLESLEQDLDQCWDLLRQRRAKRQYGENPNEAQPRPVKQVEGYSG